MQVNLLKMMDESSCYDYLRQIRWEDGVSCPHCASLSIIKNGHNGDQKYRQKYKCKTCERKFDDLTGTVFSGSNKSLKYWIMCLYLMGLNLSNAQIAKELDVSYPTAQRMTKVLRAGIVKKKPQTELSGEIEVDEVYIVCGHKGQPKKVVQANRKSRCRRLKGARGRGTLASEKPPVIGFIERGGDLVIRLLANVQQKTIKPLFQKFIKEKSLVHTDEYNIYSRLTEWNYEHKTVCHSKGEYARDDDGDGFYEVHVNTQEGVWSLLRSWLRPHRGISQENMPIYLGFFEFMHNSRKRGKAILDDLFRTILAPDLTDLAEFMPTP